MTAPKLSKSFFCEGSVDLELILKTLESAMLSENRTAKISPKIQFSGFPGIVRVLFD